MQRKCYGDSTDQLLTQIGTVLIMLGTYGQLSYAESHVRLTILM